MPNNSHSLNAQPSPVRCIAYAEVPSFGEYIQRCLRSAVRSTAKKGFHSALNGR